MNRRQFILQSASIPLLSLNINDVQSAPLEEPWLTIDVVQQHVFPKQANTPDARAIQALSYLQQNLRHAYSEEEQQLIKNGSQWINQLAQEKYNKHFIKLTNAEKEQLLRQIAQSDAGERWLYLILSNISEALVCNLVYGGNPAGIGWKWLQHQPGFPLADKAHLWYKIGYNTKLSPATNIKASRQRQVKA